MVIKKELEKEIDEICKGKKLKISSPINSRTDRSTDRVRSKIPLKT